MSLQVELLESSFELVKPKAGEFAASFYDNLFTAYPDAKPLFTTTDMAGQQKKLVASLVLVVENLRKPEALSDALKGLGARHVQYGALPEHYPLVGNALLMTFEQYLKADWTPEVKQAWVDAYGAITELMLEGADYDSAELELESAPPAAPVAPAEEGGLQVELLEQSFEKVKPVAGEFAASFYDNLFTAYPDAKPLFTTTDMAGQQKKLVASLVLVVENLRKPEALSDALKGLGARHVQYGALPEHYPLVGNALLMTFEQYLKGDWTADIKQAWVDAYGAITELMLEGADYDSAELELESAPPAVAEPPAEEGGLQVGLLEQSFEKVKPVAGEFAASFYDNLFTAYPAAKPLFATTDLPAQQKKLVASLVLVVENLRNPEALTSALKGLGARHVQYGALPEHYPLVGNALLMTFEQYLKGDWTADVKQAWVDAYGAISELMLSGADYSKADLALENAPPTIEIPTEPPASSVNWPVFGGVFGGLGILALLLILL